MVERENKALSPALERALRLEARYGNLLRWAILLASVVALGLWRGFQRSLFGRLGPELYAVVGYALFALFFSLVFRAPGKRAPFSPRARRGLLLFSYILDYLYIAVLVGVTGGFRSELYVFWGLLALKASIYYPSVREMVFIPFLSPLLWIVVAYVGARSLYFLWDRGFLLRYSGLFSLVVGATAVGWLMERRQRSIRSLGANLSRKSEALEEQARRAQRTAKELADRLLELRSLQESVKAINSSLALDELLQLIVENATQVLRGARCTIALVDEAPSRDLGSGWHPPRRALGHFFPYWAGSGWLGGGEQAAGVDPFGG